MVTADFRGFIDQMIVFVNYSLADSDSETLEKALEDIETYQAQILITNNADTETLVDNLMSAFTQVLLTINCHVSKINAVNDVTTKYQTGEDTLDALVQSAKSNEDSNCKYHLFHIR